MTKEIIEKAMEDGLVTKLRSIRDMMYKEDTPPKIKYSTNGMIFEKHKNLRHAQHTDGWVEIANDKMELLGVLYYFKKWKKVVWEQCPEIIMSDDCLMKVYEIIQKVKEDLKK